MQWQCTNPLPRRIVRYVILLLPVLGAPLKLHLWAAWCLHVQPWRWRQQAFPKCWYLYTRQHDIASHKTTLPIHCCENFKADGHVLDFPAVLLHCVQLLAFCMMWTIALCEDHISPSVYDPVAAAAVCQTFMNFIGETLLQKIVKQVWVSLVQWQSYFAQECKLIIVHNFHILWLIFGEIWFKWLPHSTFEQLCFLWESVKWKPYFS